MRRNPTNRVARCAEFVASNDQGQYNVSGYRLEEACVNIIYDASMVRCSCPDVLGRAERLFHTQASDFLFPFCCGEQRGSDHGWLKGHRRHHFKRLQMKGIWAAQRVALSPTSDTVPCYPGLNPSLPSQTLRDCHIKILLRQRKHTTTRKTCQVSATLWPRKELILQLFDSWEPPFFLTSDTRNPLWRWSVVFNMWSLRSNTGLC